MQTEFRSVFEGHSNSSGRSNAVWHLFIRNLDVAISGLAALALIALPLLPDAFASLADKLIGNDDIRTATGLLIASIAILFAISRHQQEAALERAMRPVAALANLEAITHSSAHSELRELVDEYSKIPYTEMMEGRKTVLNGAIRELRELAQGIRPLRASEYGAAQVRALAASSAPARISALSSTLFDSESDFSSAERRVFERASEEAARRGVQTTRLFLIESSTYDSLLELPFVAKHANQSVANLVGKVVFVDHLRLREPQLAQEALAVQGYLLIGSQVLFLDAPSTNMTYRGRMILTGLEVDRIAQLHERLLEHAVDLDATIHPITSRPVRKATASLEARLLSIYSAQEELKRRHAEDMQRAANGSLILADSASYYDWLRRRLEVEETRARVVKVISTRPLEVFVRDDKEREFLEWNRHAAESGTQITRIFVVSHVDLIEPHRRSALKTALTSSFQVRVVWANDAATYCASLSGGGMSIWDDVEVFLDRTYFVDPDSDLESVDGRTRPPRLLIRDATAEVFFGNHEQVRLANIRFSNVERLAERAFGTAPTFQSIIENWLTWAEATPASSNLLQNAILEVRQQLANSTLSGEVLTTLQKAN